MNMVKSEAILRSVHVVWDSSDSMMRLLVRFGSSASNIQMEIRLDPNIILTFLLR